MSRLCMRVRRGGGTRDVLSLLTFPFLIYTFTVFFLIIRSIPLVNKFYD